VTLLLWNVILAIIWAIALGPLSLTNLLVGFAVGFVVLRIGWRIVPGSDGFSESNAYFEKAWQLVTFTLFFIRALTVANLRMAWYTVGPQSSMHPGIVAVPVRRMSEIEITTLANLITLTPGTLTVDVSPDQRTLFVHVMDARDPEHVRLEIREGFERRVIDLLRAGRSAPPSRGADDA